MVALQVSKRGTITLPPYIRRKLGLDRISNPMVIIEEQRGGILLQPAVPMPVRRFSAKQIKDWIQEDESHMIHLKSKKK
jgi:bifunctional DNA-binding transcriptional regulator/antitoxin component of YhaV-PrlF toxin-antitoxin module